MEKTPETISMLRESNLNLNLNLQPQFKFTTHSTLSQIILEILKKISKTLRQQKVDRFYEYDIIVIYFTTILGSPYMYALMEEKGFLKFAITAQHNYYNHLVAYSRKTNLFRSNI